MLSLYSESFKIPKKLQVFQLQQPFLLRGILPLDLGLQKAISSDLTGIESQVLSAVQDPVTSNTLKMKAQKYYAKQV